ncbi:MAG: nucleoside triphosphate pyrophosphohydrolase [Actinomycetota bacterium]|nr:nucleoside triphosphate pyrophosphohydrolase [Actinomycetota bacterium]
MKENVAAQSEAMDLDHKLSRLAQLIAELRGEGGCPWDREQTHESLTPHLIEEAYEVLDAIELGDDLHLKEELGDILLQVVLHAQIAKEEGCFSLVDVISSIHEKIVRRHPHVFLTEGAEDKAEALKGWQAIKESEGKGPLGGISPALPALIFSAKVQVAAARVGFDWPNTGGVIDKLYEEMGELKADIMSDKAEDELGDILFTAVNLARHIKADPEIALRRAAERFKRRFVWMLDEAARKGLDFEAISSGEKERFWSLAKEAEIDDELV